MSGINESSDGPTGPPPAPELPAPSPVPVMPPQEQLSAAETGAPQDSPTASAATEPSPAATSSNAEAEQQQQVVAEMSAPLTSPTSTSTSTSSTAQAQPLAISPEPEPTAPEAPAEAPPVAAEIAAVPAPAPSPLPVLVADQSSDLSGHSVRILPTPPASARSIGAEQQQQLSVVLTADEGRAADATPPSSLTIKTLRYPNGIVKRVMSPKSPRSRERSATRTPLSVTPRRSAREFSPVPPQLSTRPLIQSRTPESRAAAATKPVELDASSTAQSIAPRPVNYVFAPWCAVGKAVRRMYSAPVDMRRPALIAVGRALRGPPPLPLPVQAQVAAANAENSNDGYSYEMADARSSKLHSAPLQRRRITTSYASSYSNRGYSTPASDFRSAVTELLIEEDFDVAETDYERHVDAIVQRLGRPTISSARMLPASIPADARARGVAGGGCLSAYLSPIRRRERDSAPTPATLPEASRAQSSSAISYAASDNSQMPSVSLGASDECRSAVTVSSRSASGTPFWCERSQPGLARSGREERPYLYGGELVWARMPFIDAHRSYLWQRDGALSRPRSAAFART